MKVLIAMAALTVAGSASAQETKTKVGSWLVTKTVDGFSDKKRGIAHTEILPKTGTLAIKCDAPGGDSLYVTFLTNEYLGSDKAGSGKFRFDDAEPATLPLPRYDKRSAHLFSSSAKSFLSQLVTSNPKRLRVQFLGYDGLVNIDVDVTGVADAIKQTAAICEDTRFG